MNKGTRFSVYFLAVSSIVFSGCSSMHSKSSSVSSSVSSSSIQRESDSRFEEDYAARLPATMRTSGRKLILIDPNVHAWGAYDDDGQLIRAGIATSGGIQCPPDSKGSCRTGVGTFRIYSLGDEGCYSRIYPKPKGGGLMPYCMFFHGGQALHGSPDPIVIEDNVSHGCVRMRIPDAEWMRYHFAEVGTKVVVRSY